MLLLLNRLRGRLVQQIQLSVVQHPSIAAADGVAVIYFLHFLCIGVLHGYVSACSTVRTAQLFLHGVVAAVKVLFVLKLGRQDLLSGGEFAIHFVDSQFLRQ